jgi:hypothetical protein
VDDDDWRRDAAHVCAIYLLAPLTWAHAPSLPDVILGPPHVPAHAHGTVKIGYLYPIHHIEHRPLTVDDRDHLVGEDVRLQLPGCRILVTKLLVLTEPAIDRIVARELVRSTQLIDRAALNDLLTEAYRQLLAELVVAGRVRTKVAREITRWAAASASSPLAYSAYSRRR